MNMLEIKNLKKSFGSKVVLQRLNLEVSQGTIFGFVGENGAGKTTTMKLILGLDQPDAGEIWVNGQQVQFGQNKTNHWIGYLPDVPAFYEYMSAEEYLKLCAQVTGMSKKESSLRIQEMLDLVHLTKVSQRIKGYSRGMRQRLGIAQALLNRPKLLICDEPTSALDPEGRHDFLQLLQQLRGEVTVLFSTHILSDVQSICDQVGILHQGVLQAKGTLKELTETYTRPQLELTFATVADAMDALHCLNREVDFSMEIQQNKLLIAYAHRYEVVSKQVLQILLIQNILPTQFQKISPDLEQIFFGVTQV